MSDPTEATRMIMTQAINSQEAERQLLTEQYGQVWSTDELRPEFEVTGFMAPFVLVTRKSDNKRGTLMFQHHPRYYFSFAEG